MIPSFYYLLAGYRVLETDRDHAAALLELCRRHTLIYEDFRHTPDGGITLRFPRTAARRLQSLCAERGIPVTAVSEGGISRLWRWLARRAGLPVGLLLGVCLLTAAQSVVWDIRISGNECVSDKAIEQSLEACGLAVGTPLRGFEADRTENDVLMQDDRLAWISINRKGTVAYVEVREKVQRPPETPESPCNIVASMGGVIERIELEEGNVRVAAGQAVGVGDVLVSGLYDSLTQGIRMTSAKARVYARTTRIMTVEIPLTYEQKVYETAATLENRGRYCEKSLIFFGNHIKFSKKTGNPSGFCDTIEDERSWGLPIGKQFPITTRTVWYLPYEIVTASRTLAEAEELAYFELMRRIASIPGGAELLGKTVTVRHSEDALTLTCTLTCIEDIGEVRPILTSNQTNHRSHT